MKTMLRVLTVWLMLVALPFQGFASASMLLCGPAAPEHTAMASMQDAPAGHDHAAMLAAAGEGAQQHDCDGAARCGGMSDCCVGAALAYATPQAPSLPPLSARIQPSEPAPPAPVDLALPKRPPRPATA